MNVEYKLKGHFTYKHTTISQHEDVAIPIKELFLKIKPTKVLEIGTAYGGLTLLVRDLLDEVGLIDSVVRSYDVTENNRVLMHEAIKNGAKIEFNIKNIFNNTYNELVAENEIQTFLQQRGTNIIMCDGGCKQCEFKMLSPLLKSGDIIMAHDYAPTLEYFHQNIKNKIWDWHEINDSDIQDSVVNCNLQPFMYEQFRDVVWVCKIKS